MGGLIEKHHIAALERAAERLELEAKAALAAGDHSGAMAEGDAESLREIISLTDGLQECEEHPTDQRGVQRVLKAEHWRVWGIHGMPKDKIKLAEETWKRAVWACTEAHSSDDLAKSLGRGLL